MHIRVGEKFQLGFFFYANLYKKCNCTEMLSSLILIYELKACDISLQQCTAKDIVSVKI